MFFEVKDDMAISQRKGEEKKRGEEDSQQTGRQLLHTDLHMCVYDRL